MKQPVYFASVLARPLVIAVSLLLVPLVGCRQSETIEDPTVPRLLLEKRGVEYGSMGGRMVTLPVSGTTIAVRQEPVVNEFEIRNVELVTVDLGLALLIQVSEKGARDLYRAAVANTGGRIVLSVNGNAIGARRIHAPIEDGNLYTFVELPDDALGDLVLELKDSLAKFQAAEK